MVVEIGLTVMEFVVPAIGLIPTVDPVPHSYVPEVPFAVSVVEVPEQMEFVPVIDVGATAAGVTVTVVVIPELFPHGAVPFTRTQ